MSVTSSKINSETFIESVNASKIGIWHWDVVKNKLVWTAEQEALYGLAPGTFKQTFDDFVRFVHPEDFETLTSTTSLFPPEAESAYEFRITRADGAVRWISAREKRVLDDQKRVLFISGVNLDVTEQKNRERALLESESQFRLLTENLPQLVWMTDEKGNQIFTSKNWETYTGFSVITPKVWAEIVHPEDLTTTTNAWLNCLESGEKYQAEVRLKGIDSSYRWHFALGAPLIDSNGKIIKWMGTLTDIHEQKKFGEKLESEVKVRTSELLKINAELESFSYIASHDLQEPLRKIQTFINMIESNLDKPEKLTHYFTKIKLSAARMRSLIDSVLLYSRVSRGGGEMNTTDLNIIFDEVLQDLELLIQESNARVVKDVLPTLKVSKMQITQLFSNILSNAIKFSSRDPIIKVSFEEVTSENALEITDFPANKKYAKISFSDNGIGFDERFSEKIFQLFQRLHSKESYSGTGLGLGIVKKIVDQHSGYVTANATPGEGSVFCVYLPL